MPSPVAAVPSCEACDDQTAPFAFTITYTDDAGAPQEAVLYFCRAHRGEGERLLAISLEAHGTGHAPRPRSPAPEPAVRGPEQLGFDL